MNIHFRKSFTLLEVMIFVMILSVVLVTAASFVTRLLYNIKMNEHRTMATFFIDDLKEWLNGERESNIWSDFHAKAGFGSSIRYCMNPQLELAHTIANLGPAPALFATGNCPSYASIQSGQPAIYKRELDLVKNNAATPTQVTATMTVSWLEIGKTSSSRIQTTYYSEF